MSIHWMHWLGAVVGGVAGTLANALLGALLLPVSFAELATSPARYVVAVLVALVFPLIYAKLHKTPAAILSLAWGLLAPSLLAKAAFDTETGWALVLSLNAVYAVVALLVYRAIAVRAAPEVEA